MSVDAESDPAAGESRAVEERESADGVVPASRATSWLFVPGHDRRKIRKALAALQEGLCQRVIVDWEDGVPADQRRAARALTCEQLLALDPRQRGAVVVRIHPARSSTFEDDLEALAGWVIGAVMLAKAEEAEDVRRCARLELPIVPLVESALGVEQALDIARADPWVRGLALGALDLLTDLRVRWQSGNPILTAARTRLVFAARAAGLDHVLLGPFPDLDEVAELREDTRSARELGFTGRLVLHPRQIAPVNEAFAPSAEDLAYARTVLEAWRQQGGRAVLEVDGHFVDRPVVVWARRLLEPTG